MADMASDLLSNGDPELERALFDILDAIGKGFSAMEILWEPLGREWAPEALQWRDPRWFLFDWIWGEQLLVRTLNSRRTAPGDARGYGISSAFQRRRDARRAQRRAWVCSR